MIECAERSARHEANESAANHFCAFEHSPARARRALAGVERFPHNMIPF
jgi:hypothetical protein